MNTQNLTDLIFEVADYVANVVTARLSQTRTDRTRDGHHATASTLLGRVAGVEEKTYPCMSVHVTPKLEPGEVGAVGESLALGLTLDLVFKVKYVVQKVRVVEVTDRVVPELVALIDQ